MKQIIPNYEKFINESKISDYLIELIEKLTSQKIKSPVTKAELDKVAKNVLNKEEYDLYKEAFDLVIGMLKNNDNIIVK